MVKNSRAERESSPTIESVRQALQAQKPPSGNVLKFSTHLKTIREFLVLLISKIS